MGQIRPNQPKINTALPNIKGSTAEILVTLYKSALMKQDPKIKDIPSDDPILKRCVIIDAKTTQIKNILIAPDEIDKSREQVTVNLHQIDSAARGRSSQSQHMNEAHAKYRREFNDLNDRSTQNDQRKDNLLQQYRQMVHQQHETLVDLIMRKPKGTITVEDIERVLKSFEKDVNQFVKSRDQLERAFEKITFETTKVAQAAQPGLTTTGLKPETKAPT